MSLIRAYTAGTPTKAAATLFDQLDKALKSDGEDLVQKTKVGAAVCCQACGTACCAHAGLYGGLLRTVISGCGLLACVPHVLRIVLCCSRWSTPAAPNYVRQQQQQHKHPVCVVLSAVGFVCTPPWFAVRIKIVGDHLLVASKACLIA
jgi:hypothetical protein